MSRDAATALGSAARFGPYFVWDRYDGGPQWQPLSDLWDADVLTARVEAARRTLTRMSGHDRDAIGERVVASVTFLGLASRLVSPTLGAVVAGAALPLPVAGGLWWRPVDGGPVPFAWRGLAAADCADRDAAAVADTFVREVVRPVVEPVLAAFGDRFALSGHVLWGNVASALGGAADMIAAGAGPAAAERAARIVDAALAEPPLRGRATLHRPDPQRARWFLVRRNCCLYYRIPGGGTCGDCVLTPDEVRRRHWRSVLGNR